MKRFILSALVMTVAAAAHAGDKYSRLKLTDVTTAKLTITTEDSESVQAAQYADGGEVSKFVDLVLANPKSAIAREKAAIEKENCDPQDAEDLALMCGSVEFSEPVRVSYYRSGWSEGGASYVVFMGFRASGTGHDLNLNRAILISESTEAKMDPNEGSFQGTVLKTYKLNRITPFNIDE